MQRVRRRAEPGAPSPARRARRAEPNRVSGRVELLSETGRSRGNFGLADLFGVRYAGRTQAMVKNSYLTLEHDTNHPILKGFDRDTRPIATRVLTSPR